jgi:hypothetical protein
MIFLLDYIQSTIVPRYTAVQWHAKSGVPTVHVSRYKREHNSRRSRYTARTQQQCACAHAWPRWGLEHADETFHLEPSHQQRSTTTTLLPGVAYAVLHRQYAYVLLVSCTNILMALSPFSTSCYTHTHTSISSTCLISVQTNHSHGLSKDSPWNPFRKQA